MTSYNELVNTEIGNSTNYGANFRLSRHYSLELAKFLKEQVGKRKSYQLMRVYCAGGMENGNTHLGHFTAAVDSLHLASRGWEIEYLSAKNIRLKEDWTHPKFLVDWFLSSDFHVLLCQGIHNGMMPIWKPLDCQLEILRLQDHRGFPNGLNLQDPVLNADKFEYLCAAADICLPSFKFPLFRNNKQVNEVMESLQQFMMKYQSFDSKKDQDFIVKAPFVQNQQGFSMRFFGTKAEFTAILNSVYNKENISFNKRNVTSIEVFPYLIVQPRIGSVRESKIILWNGTAQFVSSTIRGLKKVKDERALMDFAETACALLKARTKNAFLSDGITRVDLFCTTDGVLVVNEFESLDANYSSNDCNESRTAHNIKEYYVNILSKLL